MTCDHAKQLIAGSWQNEPDATAEQSLQQHLKECGECQSEMAALGGVWQRLGEMPAPEPSPALTLRFEATLDSLIAANPKPLRTWSFANLWPRRPAWQAAIAIACLLVGLLIGNAVSPARTGNDKEIAKLHEEIASTREMVALSLLQQQTATERLRGVEYSGSMKTLEPEIISALVHAINEDSSVNVRLAAIDALSRVSGSPSVLTSLARSLPAQDSPMVQAALVDYFVDARDRQAVGALRQLEQQPNLNPAVLERTRSALQELSQ